MNTNVPEYDVMSPIDALHVLIDMIERVESRLKGHGIRTARYAVTLGRAVGLSATELNDLCLASLLHDIGLLTVPQTLLEKDGMLTAEEYALVQSHSRAGAELLEPIPFLRVPALWIAHHHERWDGFGYPYGLRGSLIPLGARILAIADTFDSLVSPHWNGQSHDTKSALCLLQLLAGSQLDPELVDVFIRRLSGFELNGRLHSEGCGTE
jgi:HD-GYP domain-containing protein (c-di-GMP phosphodiesterase class II)